MTVLVTGGAGYIGSHTTFALLDRAEKVVVLDNLSTGNQSLVGKGAVFIEGEVGNASLLRGLIREHKIDAVIHFAGSIVVPESVERPLQYYENNTGASRTLIEACVTEGVRHFIFSSTAAVYGMGQSQAIAESSEKSPINPYGRSKLMTEWMLEDASHAHDFHYIALRYFNVAGGDAAGRTGQATPRATHLIKRACQVVLGREPFLRIYGDDYATPDGTGVRDYIHVSDLANAHLLALDALRLGHPSDVFNCGYGRGLSVKQVVAGIEALTGKKLPVETAPRRAGDPAALVADSTKLKADLGWQPQHDSLEEILRTALAWERKFNI